MPFQVSVKFETNSNEDAFFESIPRKPAVFAIFSKEAEGLEAPPYLSRTSDLRRRLTRLLGKPVSSSRRLNLRTVAGRVEYSRVGSGFEARWLLYLMNKSYYPHLYRQRLRLKPPTLLKLNLSNRFPRLYSTRRIARDNAIYYGPFRSRVEAERWSAEFLDFFKIRRCVEDRGVEAGLQDSHDERSPPVDRNGPADDLRVAAKPAAPEAVAEDDQLAAVGAIVIGGERSPQRH